MSSKNLAAIPHGKIFHTDRATRPLITGIIIIFFFFFFFFFLSFRHIDHEKRHLTVAVINVFTINTAHALLTCCNRICMASTFA